MPLQPLVFSRALKGEREEVADFLAVAFNGDFTREQTRGDVDLSLKNDLFAYHLFIGREGKEIVCAGALKHEGIGGNVWGIALISVLPGRQKQGYGRRIVEFLVQHYASNILSVDQGTIILCCKPHLFAFYDKLKFKPVDIHDGRRIYHKTVNRIAS